MKRILLYSGGMTSFCSLVAYPHLYDDIVYVIHQNTSEEKVGKIIEVLKDLQKISDYKIDLLNKFNAIPVKTKYDYDIDYHATLYDSILNHERYKNIQEIQIVCNRCKEDCSNYHGEYTNVIGRELSEIHNKKIIIINYLQFISKIDLVKLIMKRCCLTIDYISDNTYPCNSISNGMECLDCSQCMDKNAILYDFGKTRPFYNKKIIMDYSKNQIKMKLDHIVDYLKRLSLKYITRSF